MEERIWLFGFFGELGVLVGAPVIVGGTLHRVIIWMTGSWEAEFGVYGQFGITKCPEEADAFVENWGGLAKCDDVSDAGANCPLCWSWRHEISP